MCLDQGRSFAAPIPLLLACVAVLAAAAIPAVSAGDSLPLPQHVFVLAGQSNMLGRAQPVSAGAHSDSRVLVWRKNAWQVAVDPLGDPKDSQNGVGPGMSFGLGAIQTLNPQTVGLVQCAVSGTTISKW